MIICLQNSNSLCFVHPDLTSKIRPFIPLFLSRFILKYEASYSTAMIIRTKAAVHQVFLSSVVEKSVMNI